MKNGLFSESQLFHSHVEWNIFSLKLKMSMQYSFSLLTQKTTIIFRVKKKNRTISSHVTVIFYVCELQIKTVIEKKIFYRYNILTPQSAKRSFLSIIKAISLKRFETLG